MIYSFICLNSAPTTHPQIYFYGNDDPLARLDLLDSYLDEFEAIKVDSAVTYQPKKTEPWTLTQSFPATEVGTRVPLRACKQVLLLLLLLLISYLLTYRHRIVVSVTQVTKDKGMVALNWLVNDQPLTMKDQVRFVLSFGVAWRGEA